MEMSMEGRMHMAMWIASVFGPYLTVVGLWMLLYSENLIKIMTAIKNSPAIFYLMGVLNFLIGLAMVHTFNIWMWDLTVFVTLLGWLLVLRGVLALFIPQLLIKTMMTNHTAMKLMGLIPFVWGLIFCGFAFLR